jgi:hypothetical protein
MASQDRAWTPQEALYPADELEEVLGQERCAELKQECTEEILPLHLFNEFEWETSPRKKRIDIVDLSSTDVKHLTRFTISEIKRIRRLLGIPDRFSTPARVPFHGDEALFLLLCRLAHPIKVRSREVFFGYRESTVSEATHLFCPIRVRGRATDRPAEPRMGQNLAGIRLGRRFSVKANGPPQA